MLNTICEKKEKNREENERKNKTALGEIKAFIDLLAFLSTKCL